MDRNIKAELSSLRDEVLTSLKNLEKLVVNIDTKLLEAEESSIISRSPGLVNLLNQCRNVKWSPDASRHDIQNFEQSIKRVTELWSISDVERSERATNDLIALLKNLESISPITGKSAHESYWENISPGITEKVDETVDNINKPTGDVDTNIDTDGIISATKKMYAAISEGTGGKNDISDAPAWAKDEITSEHQTLLDIALEWAKNTDKKTSKQL
jgi:hypothetical protein